MTKNVHSVRTSDKTWRGLEKKAKRLGFASVGRMLESENELEDMKTRMAIRRDSILRYCDHRAVNEYAKAIAKNRGLTLQEAQKFLHENMTPSIMHSLVRRSIKLGIKELDQYGIPELSEDTPEFETESNSCPYCDTKFPSKSALKKHVKAEHPEEYVGMYKSGRKVGGT